ncbi:S-layer homology domain-containing protein [Schnuerera ultunensis]|uniref:S-layer homology domain-containing protein n=1 Tax=Schnuerera ultunensis TaxID=45497 RepID=UPI00040F8DDD|nr:S-layer homology domain-containing protein [Schnuerera ultunensis]
MKKVLSLVLALVIILSNFSFAFGAPSEEELYNQAGKILENIGVLKGSETGDLMLGKNLKRQDMVVLISRLYKEEDKARNYPIKDNFTDVKNPFYKPYISWAVDRGLIIGTGQGKFGYDNPVKIQQFQTLLLRVLRYSEEVKNYSNAPEVAKTLGLMDGLSAKPDEDLKRGLMAAMTLNALKTNIKGSSIITLAQELNLDIPDIFDVKANPTIDKNNIKFEGVAKGTNALKVHLKPLSSEITSGEKYYDIPLEEDGRFSYLIENLQPGKYEYKFISGNLSTRAQSITIQELPFELKDIRGDNLKEIIINFTAPVDKASSLFPSNYTTNAGTIKSVRLENNDTTVILTLNETMKNQNTYKISINRIKSSKGKELNIRDKEFKVIDNEIPQVEDIKQLGNKGLRIYMSEPVKNARSSNFKIDGKTLSAQVETEDNVITLKYHSSYYAPEEGRHILNVSGLVDYADYKALDQNIPFDIVKDTKPPKIVDQYTTIEEVIIQFDEDIDPSSVTRTNFYWKSGSSKRYPNSVKVLNDKVVLDYSKDNLPTYEIILYINSVGDYSDNKLRNEEIKIKPYEDTTAPEVIGLTVSEDGKTITVYYSKNVDAKNRAYYDIIDEKGNRVFIKSVDGSGREYRINLNTHLPIGKNTITIEGIVDSTASRNRLIPYSQNIYMDDVEAPKIISHSGKDNQITLLFNKDMDPSTVEDRGNYLIDFGGRYTYLPNGTEFKQVYDGKTYVITLPEEIDGKRVDIGRSGNVREFEIRGLKSTNGILVEPARLKFDDANQGEAVVKEARLVEPDTIVVKFDQPILYASFDDFRVSGKNVYDVKYDGSEEVIIYLEERDATTVDGKLNIRSNNSIETILNTKAKADYITVKDEVKPRIDARRGRLSISGKIIYLPFTEKLDKKVESLFRDDLIVEVSGKEILDRSKYSTILDTDGSTIKIIIDSNINAPDGYLIRLKDDPKYIMDTSGNVVEYDGYDYYTR